MVRPAPKAMTLDEFLDWEDGTDTRYELFDGVVVAMAPPAVAHGIIAANTIHLVRLALKPPCVAVAEAGIVVPHKRKSYYQADLAVTCGELRKGTRYLDAPTVVFEVLSPSTGTTDLLEKGPDYHEIPSVREVVFISSIHPSVEVQRRTDAGWMIEHYRSLEARIPLRSIDLQIPMADLYSGVHFED